MLNPSSHAFFSIIGSSAEMRDVVRLAERVAASPAFSVLLVGEAGTGKELMARCIHRAGRSAGEPFISVNCGALPPDLLHAELFGTELGDGERRPGAFELAGRGTVFLKDVGEMPPALQHALLTLLESRRLVCGAERTEVRAHCRIIVSAKSSLRELAARGRLIPPLFERLSVLALTLPPLRERRQDVEQLIQYFLMNVARSGAPTPARVPADTLAALRAHPWPGNVRELRYIIESGAVLAGDQELRPEHLRLQQRHARSSSSSEERVIRFPASGKTLAQLEAEAMAIALELTGGNQSAAARMLGISRHTLLRRMQAEQLRFTPEGLVALPA